MPDVRVDVRQRLAGISVNKLDIHEQRHTGLVLGHVAADELSGDVCSVHCKGSCSSRRNSAKDIQ